MHVEDHPLEYGDFEGVIPEGEYGGGTVMLWDRGTWTPEGDPREGYRKGTLKFTLHGERLRGGWALVRMRGRNGTGRRAHVAPHQGKGRRGPAAVGCREDRGQGEERRERPHHGADRGGPRPRVAVEQGGGVRHGTPGGPAPAKAARGPRAATRKPAARAAARAGRVAALPRFVPPQLATLVAEPPEGDEWLHEMKFDGYRILARLERGRARLLSRNAKDWTARLSAVAEAAAHCPPRDRAPRRRGGRPASRRHHELPGAPERAERRRVGGALAYIVFDLLHLDGRDLTGLPLEERKAALRRLARREGGRQRPRPLQRSRRRQAAPTSSARRAAFASRASCPSAATRPIARARARLAEGQVRPPRRRWSIGGFTPPAGSRAGLGALLVGVLRRATARLRRQGGHGLLRPRTSARSPRGSTKLEQRESPFDPPPRIAGARAG